jgi:hypothetical protein
MLLDVVARDPQGVPKAGTGEALVAMGQRVTSPPSECTDHRPIDANRKSGTLNLCEHAIRVTQCSVDRFDGLAQVCQPISFLDV